MGKSFKEWCRQHPLRIAIILTAVMTGFTIMWVIVALGPDALLDENCYPGRRSCVDSHEEAWIWAVITAPIAVFFGVRTWRLVRARNRIPAAKDQLGEIESPSASSSPMPDD
jgi:hypothetical protein